jgi:pyrroline-5-carboxylate reductase
MTVVGVIGTGNMGAALVKGWLRAAPEDVGFVVWDKIPSAATRLLVDDRVRVAASLDDLVAQAGVVLVVVKPKDAPDLLQAIRPALSDRHTVISSMAGVTLDSLRAMTGPGPTLFRIMPNLGVELIVGVVAVAAEPGADQAGLQAILALLQPLGLAQVLPEDMIDVATAVGGSGPGFLALAIEALEDGAVAAGITRPEARRLVREAACRTVEELHQHSDSPGALRSHLASTGQLFAPGLGTIEKFATRMAFQQAVAAAVEKSRRSGGSHVSPR